MKSHKWTSGFSGEGSIFADTCSANICICIPRETNTGVMSASEDLDPEGLTVAEENVERSETPEPPPDSPSTADRLRGRLRERLRTRRSEDRSKAFHRDLRSSSPEY